MGLLLPTLSPFDAVIAHAESGISEIPMRPSSVPKPEPKIFATDNGFAIVGTKATDAVSLDEMSEVVAYEIAKLTTDLVCCDIVTGLGDEECTHGKFAVSTRSWLTRKPCTASVRLQKEVAQPVHPSALRRQPHHHRQSGQERHLTHPQTVPTCAKANAEASLMSSGRTDNHPNEGLCRSRMCVQGTA
ncbi:hypothetical protein OKA06_11525 [Novosphingobium sp. MW5]|nr:hypothetical protein [Novosphingobium sp. MW5]